jgi:ribose/xylose/arabinose/galactoside ABC-type transport system permease subunit
MNRTGSKQFVNLIGLLVALVAVFGVFSYLVPNGAFHTVDTITTILRQSTIIMLCSIGMTFVIISAGIDLSVASTTAFCSVTVAWCIERNYGGAWAVAGAMAAGVFFGWLNGFLITRLKVGPFIVTLGTLLIVRALAKGLADNKQIEPSQKSWIDPLLDPAGGHGAGILLPWGVWLVIISAVAASLVLRYTRFGRHVVAVGSNEAAARLCGVPIDRIKLVVYGLNGFFAGLAGILLYSRLTVGDPTAVFGMELDVIAAVVIGGASLNGGEGTIVGTIVGALIMQTIRSGTAQKGYDVWVQELITGTIIVLAVGLDRWRVRRAAGRM